MGRPALRYWCEREESFNLWGRLLPGLCPDLRRNPAPEDDTLCHAQDNKRNPTCLEHTEKASAASKDTRFLVAVIMGASLRVPSLGISQL